MVTAWADPCPQARLAAADVHRVLARKVVSNLFLLQRHPGVCPELRQSLAQAHARRVGPAHPAQAGSVAPLEAGSPALH